jgi:CheY-like chemotaxis protein
MNQLEGTNVLVVEDGLLPAAALCSALREMGARIVGPAATVSEALVLLASEQVDGAILDVSLGGDLV